MKAEDVNSGVEDPGRSIAKKIQPPGTILQKSRSTGGKKILKQGANNRCHREQFDTSLIF